MCKVDETSAERLWEWFAEPGSAHAVLSVCRHWNSTATAMALVCKLLRSWWRTLMLAVLGGGSLAREEEGREMRLPFLAAKVLGHVTPALLQPDDARAFSTPPHLGDGSGGSGGGWHTAGASSKHSTPVSVDEYMGCLLGSLGSPEQMEAWRLNLICHLLSQVRDTLFF